MDEVSVAAHLVRRCRAWLAAACARALLALGAVVTVLDRADGAPWPACARPAPARGDRPTSRRRRCSTRATTWSSRPASPRTPAGTRGGRGRLPSTPSRSWPGGCAAGAPPWLARHRHQRQDDHDDDARGDPARGRPAHRRARQHRRAARRRDGRRYDVLAVELSSFQLHWSSPLAPQIGALLNLADDHLDWHGRSTRTPRPRRRSGGRRRGRGGVPWATSTTRAWPPPRWPRSTGRPVGFTLGEPGAGQFGVRRRLAGGPRVRRRSRTS